MINNFFIKSIAIAIIFIGISYSLPAQTDTSNIGSKNFKVFLAIGPQLSFTDKEDFMIGGNIVINSLLIDQLLISLDLHGAFTNHTLDATPDLVEGLATASIMAGYRLYLNRQSDFQFQVGVGYGELTYRNDRYGSELIGYNFHRDKIKFLAMPMRLTYQLYHKMVGIELFASFIVHPHHETGIGVNFLIGKVK